MKRPSRKNFMICAAVVAFAFVTILFVAVLPDREPLYQGRPVMAWGRDLLSPNPEVRSNATEVVRSLGIEAVPVWTKALRRQDPIFKSSFLAVARKLPLPFRRALRRVIKPFDAESDRLAAANALDALGSKAPIDPLLQVLKGPDHQVGSVAAATLGRIGRPAVPGLTLALSNSDPEVRSLTCYAISIVGPDAAESIPALILRLNDSHINIRSQAMFAISRVGKPALPHLLETLKSPDAEVRALAVVALAGSLPPTRDTTSALIEAARDPSSLVRLTAVESLGNVWPAAADSVQTFGIALDDADATVRVKALQALAKAGNRATPAVPGMIKLLDDADPAIRALAALALEQLGPRANAAVPALKSRLHDTNTTVRTRVTAALFKIDPDSAPAPGKTSR